MKRWKRIGPYANEHGISYFITNVNLYCDVYTFLASLWSDTWKEHRMITAKGNKNGGKEQCTYPLTVSKTVSVTKHNCPDQSISDWITGLTNSKSEEHSITHHSLSAGAHRVPADLVEDNPHSVDLVPLYLHWTVKCYLNQWLIAHTCCIVCVCESAAIRVQKVRIQQFCIEASLIGRTASCPKRRPFSKNLCWNLCTTVSCFIIHAIMLTISTRQAICLCLYTAETHTSTELFQQLHKNLCLQ